jgi:phosphotransferase system enzyme I (PtsP)
MLASHFPRLDSQETLYRAVLEAAGERLVTFRTLDIGGDKRLPYMKAIDEENPALGWRAVRIGLDKPALLRIQMRAMLRAAAGRRLRLMLPMVSNVEEYRQGRALLDRELAFLHRLGRTPPASVALGAMLEVPSLLWQLEEIAAVTDFLSVGSNDLMQYLFAADRDNKRVADRFDVLSPAFLRALRRVAEIGEAGLTPVALCGEIGGRPLEAMTLIALGFRDLSMSATSIGPIKAMILSLPLQPVRDEVMALVDRRDGRDSLREPLRELAERHGVRL